MSWRISSSTTWVARSKEGSQRAISCSSSAAPSCLSMISTRESTRFCCISMPIWRKLNTPPSITMVMAAITHSVIKETS
ncbi:hypothetical protein D3C79_1053150 [compost metagenome]